MQDYTEHNINTKGTDYVVGDIHGEYQKLMDQLDEIGFDRTKDRLFSVGDLIDRGPENLKCLGLIEEPWFFAVCGNHEDMMLHDHRLWFMNGGNWFYDEVENSSNKENTQIFRRLLNKVKRMPIARTVHVPYGTVGICHAQPPSNDREDVSDPQGVYSAETMLWGRTAIKGHPREDVKNVTYTIHGHTPSKMPIINGNRLFIDSGAVFESDQALIILNISEDPKQAIKESGEYFDHDEFED